MSVADGNAALMPRDTADVIDVLRADSRELEPIGHGSKRSIGRLGEAVLLDLSALDGIVDYRPEELVLSAGPGMRLDAVGQLLGEHGQRLAFEPPCLGKLLGVDLPQTLGGVLSANLSGSRRIAAGAARDHFLGVEAVNGRGELFRAGGKVVKNVTGYDLPKLLAGSWGTLAVMTEVTLKVVPAAQFERTLVLPDVAAAAEAVGILSTALGSAHEVSSAGFDPWRGAAIRFEGIPESVAARSDALLDELGRPEIENLEADASRDFWRHLAAAEALADWRVIWRLSVPPADAPRVLEAISPERFVLDWGGGLIWAAFDRVDAARVRGSLREGHATLIKAPPDTRACRQHPPSAALGQFLERVRAAFDPDRRLNPGRMD